MRELCTFNNPVLKTKCTEVTEFNNELSDIITDMRNTMLKYNGCGLAAPQIGESKRIIIIKRQIKKGILIIINPEIVSRSQYTNSGIEGCLSYPEYIKQIERPNSVTVKGQNINGKEFTLTLNNLEARIACHEVDHLNGLCQVSIGVKKEKLNNVG